MAKIPRINQGDRPSSAINPGAPDMSAVNATRVLGGMADTALDVATTEELRERKRLMDIAIEKKAITDTLDAGARAGELEDQMMSVADSLKEKYADNPVGAIDEFQKEAEKMVAEHTAASPNSVVQLDLAQQGKSLTYSSIRSLHEWVSAKQTQNAKGHMAKMIQSASNDAAFKTSVGALEGWAAETQARLGPMMEKAFGADAPDEMAKLLSAGAQQYSDVAASKFPLQHGKELESSKFLRDNLRNIASSIADADRGVAGYHNTQEIETLKQAYRNGEGLAAVVGKDGFVEAAYTRRVALEAQKITVAQDNNLGPAAKKSLRDKLDSQIELVDTLRRINYGRAEVVAVDDPDTIRAITVHQDALFGKDADSSAKEHLDLVVAQQRRLAVAMEKKQITLGTYKTKLDDVSLAYAGAIAKETGNTGLWEFAKPRQVGNQELNTRFKTNFKDQSADVQARVRERYISLFIYAKNHGGVTEAHAVRLAQEALTQETGREIKGLYK